jgi:hypothetical protein
MAAFFEKKTGSSWQPGIMICLEPDTAGFVRLSPATQTTGSAAQAIAKGSHPPKRTNQLQTTVPSKKSVAFFGGPRGGH